MRDAIIDFGVGILTGGLSLSIGWGLFWLAISSVGLARGTCTWRAVLNSMVVGTIPLCLVWGLLWAMGTAHGPGPAFASGLSVMPLVLIGFGLRQAPDGQRAGIHMLNGVRHLMDELLGRHHECGGCGHEHHHDDHGHQDSR